MLARRTRSLPLRIWRGTPEELREFAASVVEAMEVAQRTALQQYQTQVYERYAADLTGLQEELGIADPSALDPDDELTQTYTLRAQLLWQTTQRAIEQGKNLIAPTNDFGYTLRGGVQESGSTPDIFAGERLPRNVIGVWMRCNVFAHPTASVTAQLQNAPYSFLQLEVGGEDWVWMEATFGRLTEQVRRGESSFIGMLYRPFNTVTIILVGWMISSLLVFEVLRQLPYRWFQDRLWLGGLLGTIPLIVFLNVLGWLYPRFEVLRSVAREQTDAARWLIVGLITAAVLALGRWVLLAIR